MLCSRVDISTWLIVFPDARSVAPYIHHTSLPLLRHPPSATSYSSAHVLPYALLSTQPAPTSAFAGPVTIEEKQLTASYLPLRITLRHPHSIILLYHSRTKSEPEPDSDWTRTRPDLFFIIRPSSPPALLPIRSLSSTNT